PAGAARARLHLDHHALCPRVHRAARERQEPPRPAARVTPVSRPCVPTSGTSTAVRPAIELADIVRQYGETFRRGRALTPEQHAALRDIERCRTAALGGHLDVCRECGHEQPRYNSCRNRHCPKCQALAQARWVEGRMARILPTSYFHVVFTLPAALRTLARLNRRLVFDAMLAA